MALVAKTNRGESIFWFSEESTLHIRSCADRVTEVTLDGKELLLAQDVLKVGRDIKLHSLTFYGDVAKFIVGNIINEV